MGNKPIQPLGNRDACGEGQRWTENIFVYGDDVTGQIKLTSEDGTTSRVYGAVTQDLATKHELTIFKGSSDIFFRFIDI